MTKSHSILLLVIIAAYGATGSLLGWGNNAGGQLGAFGRKNVELGAEVDLYSEMFQQAGGIVDVAVSQQHIVVRTADNQIFAWGEWNTMGQVRNTASATPVKVDIAATHIVAGYGWTVAVTTSGQLVGWGRNSMGLLGAPVGETVLQPRQIDMANMSGRTISRLITGMNTDEVFALTTSGELFGWGRNYHGNLGDNSTTTRTAPVKAMQGSYVIRKVALGSSHTVAVTETNVLLAWGMNLYDKSLGVNSSADYVLTPMEVLVDDSALAGKTIADVFAAYFASYAVDTDGVVYRWGINRWIGGMYGTLVPRPVSGIGGLAGAKIDQIYETSENIFFLGSVSGDMFGLGNKVWVNGLEGSNSTHATRMYLRGTSPECLPKGIRHNGITFIAFASCDKIIAWGASQGDYLPFKKATYAMELNKPTGVKSLKTAQYFSAAIVENDVVAWGSFDRTTITDVVTSASASGLFLPASQIQDLAFSNDHFLFLDKQGQVFASGLNTFGQLGDGTLLTRTSPVSVSIPGSPTIASVAVGSSSSYALTTNGELFSWGANMNGQLGLGDSNYRNTPTRVTITFSVSKFIAGPKWCFAISLSGQVVAWGDSQYSGVDSSSSPQALTFGQGEEVVKIAVGSAHSIALTKTGAIYVWGNGDVGQLGDGSPPKAPIFGWSVWVGRPKALTNIPLEGSSIVDIFAGSYSSFVKTGSGAVFGWGSNAFGEISTLLNTSIITPVRVGILNSYNVSSIVAGDNYVLALTNPIAPPQSAPAQSDRTAIIVIGVVVAFVGVLIIIGVVILLVRRQTATAIQHGGAI